MGQLAKSLRPCSVGSAPKVELLPKVSADSAKIGASHHKDDNLILKDVFPLFITKLQ